MRLSYPVPHHNLPTSSHIASKHPCSTTMPEANHLILTTHGESGMKVEKIIINCPWCKEDFKGRSYQTFCTQTCADKSYYWHKSRGLKREKPDIICDICGTPFKPKRDNVKRCSDVCRQKWARQFAYDRAQKLKERKAKNAQYRNCIVCGESFMVGRSRRTCSSKCSNKYQRYSVRQRAKVRANQQMIVDNMGRSVITSFVAMPEQKPIPVGKIDLSSSDDLKIAMEKFVKEGGKIRKYKDMVEVDLLEDENPLVIKEDTEEEIESQIFGTVTLK